MADLTFSYVDIDLLKPNPWNPNAMNDEMFGKAIESIHRFGFVDPVTVREVGMYDYQIIDGEHRWRGAREHSGSCVFETVKGKAVYTEHIGLRQIPIANLGLLEDPIAKQLTIVLNETRGEYDPKKMGSVLTSLLAGETMPALLEVLPFTPVQFAELAELPTVDWGLSAPKRKAPSDEKWVERVYRLPTDAATKLDEAIAAARSGGEADWRCLQTIAERFLST